MVEWSTTSAPSASGFCRYGVAKVLSTTTIAPAAWAASEIARRSRTFSIGLDGDSSQTIRVRSSRCAAASAFSRRHVLERVALRLVHLRGHPVDAAVDVRDEDAPVARAQQVHERGARADPGRVREAEPAPSSDASAVSSAVRVGLATRE